MMGRMRRRPLSPGRALSVSVSVSGDREGAAGTPDATATASEEATVAPSTREQTEQPSTDRATALDDGPITALIGTGCAPGGGRR